MSTKNIYKDEAKNKIKELAESIDFTMMGTNFSHRPLHVIPMSTKKVDEMGSIWFLSNRNSDHNKHIRNEGRAQLIYSDPSRMEFMTVYGDALIITDAKVLKDLYSNSDEAWFNGVDDPNLTAIQIKPTTAYYWDTAHNKLVSLFEIGMAAISGEKTDLGIQGRIEL